MSFVTLAFWQCVALIRIPAAHLRYTEGWKTMEHICHTRMIQDVDEDIFALWQPAFEVIGTPSDFVQSFNVAQLNLFSSTPPTLSRFGDIWGISVRRLKHLAEVPKVGSGWQTVSGPDNALRINPYWENSSLLRIDQLLRCNCIPQCVRPSIWRANRLHNIFESRPITPLLERRGPS